MKYERERCCLALSTGVQQPSARLSFFTAGLLYFESNSCIFSDAYCHGHTGSRPERVIGSLLASTSRRCLEKTGDSDPQLALIHPKHAKPSRSPISIAWKSVEGGARILAWVVVTTRYVCPGVLCRSRSYLNRFSLFTYCHERPVYHRDHLNCLIGIVVATRASNHPPAGFAIHYNTLRAAKEQPDVTSDIPCILSLLVSSKHEKEHPKFNSEASRPISQEN